MDCRAAAPSLLNWKICSKNCCIAFSSFANSRPFLLLPFMMAYIYVYRSTSLLLGTSSLTTETEKMKEKKRKDFRPPAKRRDSRDRTRCRGRRFLLFCPALSSLHLDGSVQLSCHCTFNYFNESITPIVLLCVFRFIACSAAQPPAAVKEYEEEEYWPIVLPVLWRFVFSWHTSPGSLRQLGSASDHFSASQLTRNGTREFSRDRSVKT